MDIPDVNNNDREIDKNSEERKQYIENLIKKYKRSERRAKIKKYFSRTAAVAVIVIGVFSAVMYNADAVKNMVSHIQDAYTSDNYGESNSYKDELVSLEYLPKGFELGSRDIGEGLWCVLLEFKNGDDWIHVGAVTIGNVSDYDTEDAEVSYIEINGLEGFVSVKKGLTIVVWHDITHEFSVITNLSKREGIKIAKNFRKNY